MIGNTLSWGKRQVFFCYSGLMHFYGFVSFLDVALQKKNDTWKFATAKTEIAANISNLPQFIPFLYLQPLKSVFYEKLSLNVSYIGNQRQRPKF